MKPRYLNKPISSIFSLAKSLQTTVEELQYLSANADKYFFLANRVQKDDGSYRETYDVSQKLKNIHDKITKNILKKVYYPDYLQGSLSKKDHISNARIHSGKKIIVKGDISNFFPSISKDIIYQVWIGFFNFSKEVAELLSSLTTFNGRMVQGCKTSSYLANLVLWSREYKFVELLRSQGFTYTRYVDDVHVSSERIMNQSEKTKIISGIYNLFASINVRPNRKKQEIMPRNRQQTVHKLNVDKSMPSMPKQKRNEIRQLVFLCGKSFGDNSLTINEYTKMYNSVMGNVNYLRQIHPEEGNRLFSKLKLITPSNRFI
ncbi:RNA-directed DNA polymerase [Providencia stuartii]|uniref:reverse transcriptase family protein n=1 Tax=Providencia TaxID=586 RepID=UPI0018C4DB5A|nr:MULTISPECIES: reverse transcriptase family protein [Providencia]ELR5041688.1 RNA-directed DNA polymerase [Providencia stuartii]ELR5080560.1 RNA-directed DNA polymerase [Providencia stuartii]MBG5896028.1 RNA-directed DNA polymerase [Providencia stuartii]